MIRRRTSLAFLFMILLIPMSGCLGSDDKADPAAPTSVTDKGQGVDPNVKIVLEPTTFDATGTVERQKRTIAPTVPVVQQPRDEYRFLWKFENLPKLGADTNKGEIFYQVWAGTLNPDTGNVQYVPGELHSGHNNTVIDSNKWAGANGRVTHYLLSMESADDAIMDFPLVEIGPMTANEAGSWSNESMDPFTKAYGEVKLSTPVDGKLNLTVKVFGLPEKKGGYDAFLQTSSGPTFLGHLELVPSLGTVGTIKQIDESLLKDWSVFVTYEPKTQDEVPSYLTVLKSKFKS